MIITMQGNWTVRVKSQNAGFPQRFIISGATGGNGTYNGVTTTPAVPVTGTQWTIAIQHNPGTGFQLSDSKLIFPQQVGGNYEFDIQSDDSGGDGDFNDLILTCSRPATPNNFIIYGNVSLYSGFCVFNPCRRDIFVLETPYALATALKNARLRKVIEDLYPERVPPFKVDPNPPDPPYFTPVVIDLFGEAMQPKTTMSVSRIPEDTSASTSSSSKASAKEAVPPESNFSVKEAVSTRNIASDSLVTRNKLEIASAINTFFRRCNTEPGAGLTLTFEEYDRTVLEQSGGPYSGTGDRRLLGDTITDMFGNYIFRFAFDMTFPFLEDADDSFPGQSVNEYAYPDVIVKATGLASWDVLYESAPYYNIPNLKRINLCLPKSRVNLPSSCANGNLIGSLGNVFVGGNQNSTPSYTDAALTRLGNGNILEPTGKISVHNSQAGFAADCAAWTGKIDIFGCIYDETKPLSDNHIRWYTIRIGRKTIFGGPPVWAYVTENYKHPLFHKRNLPNYYGDDVGPFPRTIGGAPNVPAYKNIRYELHQGGPDTDWENAHIDRLIKLNTGLYDIDGGVSTPGTFYLRIDGYDDAGNHVAGKTDLIALFIHNAGINFSLEGLKLTDPSVVDAGCGLFRLTDAQNNTPMEFKFMANDPYGFLDHYSLTTGRCPPSTIALNASPMADTSAGTTVLAEGGSTSLHSDDDPANSCAGYTGTLDEFGVGKITTTVQPGVGEVGWIKPGEYFTVYSFGLSASQRITDGYSTLMGGHSPASIQIMLEKLNP